MTLSFLAWAKFILCVSVIGLAGFRLVRYGDAIAALTGMSRNWVGMILIATVTSLPELVAGLSAVTLVAAPDIAVGDALGSCVFNLAIFALVDLLYRDESVYARASPTHILSAAFGVLLLGATGLAILLSAGEVIPVFGHVSAASGVLLMLYLFAMRTVYRLEQRQGIDPAADLTGMSLGRALTGYGIAASAIVAAGIWLPFVGVELAQTMGWTNSFVGTLFIAFATSVPEIATTLGALRIGAIDMALGNLPVRRPHPGAGRPGLSARPDLPRRGTRARCHSDLRLRDERCRHRCACRASDDAGASHDELGQPVARRAVPDQRRGAVSARPVARA